MLKILCALRAISKPLRTPPVIVTYFFLSGTRELLPTDSVPKIARLALS